MALIDTTVCTDDITINPSLRFSDSSWFNTVTAPDVPAGYSTGTGTATASSWIYPKTSYFSDSINSQQNSVFEFDADEVISAEFDAALGKYTVNVLTSIGALVKIHFCQKEIDKLLDYLDRRFLPLEDVEMGDFFRTESI